jgi:hypothetical protein
MTLGIATGKEVSKSSVFFSTHTERYSFFFIFTFQNSTNSKNKCGNVFIRPNYGRFNFAKI